MVIPRSRSCWLLFVALPLVFARVDVGWASSADRETAIGLAEEGRCEAALPLLSAAQTEPPSDARLARLEGECAIRLQDFALAVTALERARAIDASEPDVDLRLAQAYYHAGRVDDAAEALARVPEAERSRAEVQLYLGLVAYAGSDYAEAMDRLDGAAKLHEAPVEPMASFFAGRAAVAADERERARSAFERVIASAPGTAWAEEAQRAIGELEASGGPAWWASVELGFEADDNPLLRGTGVGLPSEIAGQSDVRGYWFVDAGTILLDLDGTQVGATIRYGGSEHNELERFDTHAPGASIWLDRATGLAETTLRLQYDFDVAWIDADAIDADPFVISQLVGLTLFKPWSGGAYTTVSTNVGVDDYRYGLIDFGPDGSSPPGPGPTCLLLTADFCGPVRNEADATDRDGVGVSTSLRHRLPLPVEQSWLARPWLEAEYRYHRYWSEGSEYDHRRHQLELGFGAVLPFEIGLRVSGRYAYVPYGNPSVFPDPSDVANATVPGGPGEEYFLDTRNRREHETGVRVSLQRAIGEHVVLTTRYSRTRNRSTADVFSYTRDLVGVSVRVALGG